MVLGRLRAVSLSTARQRFGATVAPVTDYASSVWMHTCGWGAMPYDEQGAESRSPSDHRSLRYSGNGHRGSRSKHPDDTPTTRRENYQAVGKPPHAASDEPTSEVKYQRVPEVYFPATKDRPRALRYPNRQNGDHPALRVDTMRGPSDRNHRLSERPIRAANSTQDIRIATSPSERRDMVGIRGATRSIACRIANRSRTQSRWEQGQN